MKQRNFTRIWEDILEVGLQICEELGYAHPHGVTGKDVRRENNLFTEPGLFPIGLVLQCRACCQNPQRFHPENPEVAAFPKVLMLRTVEGSACDRFGPEIWPLTGASGRYCRRGGLCAQGREEKMVEESPQEKIRFSSGILWPGRGSRIE